MIKNMRIFFLSVFFFTAGFQSVAQELDSSVKNKLKEYIAEAANNTIQQADYLNKSG